MAFRRHGGCDDAAHHRLGPLAQRAAQRLLFGDASGLARYLLGTYLVVWFLTGAVASAASHAFSGVATDSSVMHVAMGVLMAMGAAVYQTSAWRRDRFSTAAVTVENSALASVPACACSTPAPRVGHALVPSSSLRVGLVAGTRCVLRCGPFMLALHTLSPSSLWLMLAGTALMFVERRNYKLGTTLTAAFLIIGGVASFVFNVHA
jgi:hypothetical protein